jgi:hypothetical protein
MSRTKTPKAKAQMIPDKTELLRLYERMVLLRQFEEAAGLH